MIVVLWLLWLVWLAVKFVGWILGALLFALWWMQAKLLYMPVLPEASGPELKHNHPGSRSPAEYELEFEEVHTTARDGARIHGWFVRARPAVLRKLFPHQQQNQEHDQQLPPTLIFCHGNAGNIGFRLPNVADLAEKCGCNVLIFDYRGYGDSQDGSSKPCERGLLLDAEAIMDWLLARPDLADPRRVFVFGRSLGGAVAIGLTERRPSAVRGLLLENTFTDVPDMALVLLKQLDPSWATREAVVKGLRFLLWMFASDRWSSIERIERLRCDVLFLSGRKDELVPPEQMDRLFARASAVVSNSSRQVEMLEIPDGHHNDTHTRPGPYYRRIRDFVWRLPGQDGGGSSSSSSLPSAAAVSSR